MPVDLSKSMFIFNNHDFGLGYGKMGSEQQTREKLTVCVVNFSQFLSYRLVYQNWLKITVTNNQSSRENKQMTCCSLIGPKKMTEPNLKNNQLSNIPDPILYSAMCTFHIRRHLVSFVSCRYLYTNGSLGPMRMDRESWSRTHGRVQAVHKSPVHQLHLRGSFLIAINFPSTWQRPNLYSDLHGCTNTFPAKFHN